ncbi:hypothetical protein JCGZ_22005 [Jatropha curcas]|uniref:MSP domain-containing protein n=1 Tax=Jatropha curcas TaxID=180498 RepID=A0A067JPS9_JATCU|nr:protein VAPYRIN-LIKE [Jatropha curcas]KDP21534.1 hypothetical protein JCGZ_22005 [Jatropha curcas]
MDRLVKPDVKEVEIAFKRGQKCTTTFRLTNLMHTMSVAVSLTTTNPSVFSFTQVFSIIPPLSSSSYNLVLSQSPDPPSLCSPPDVITVKSAMLPTGKAHMEDLRRLFSRPGSHIFRDASIPISIVGPHFAEYLISNHAQISDVYSYFNRAISGCTRSEFTTLLKSAVLSGNAILVAKLLDIGGDVNCKDSEGQSLITQAIKAGNIEVVRVLIASDCLIDNLIDKVLHEAAAINRVDIMEVLCSHFKDIDANSIDLHGRTPIHVAASYGHVEVIRFCSSIGGKVDSVDCNGCTPLHLASEKGHLEAVECLLDCSGYIKYAVNKEGKTAFALAVENGNSYLYSLLQLGDALHRAARLGDVNGIKRCITEGANVNDRDQNGWTPLHRAAFKGRIESVKALISHGGRVDVVDDLGYSPLHCAVEAGQVQVALFLIANGAKANLKSIKTKNCSPSVFSKEKEPISIEAELPVEFEFCKL